MWPALELNFLAIGVCVIVGMPLGFAWFGPVFGKAWAAEIGSLFAFIMAYWR